MNLSYAIYYPFGMLMPNRHYSQESYRYSFQGQETDDEIAGEGNAVNYKYRMHDARIGRFFSVDPLAPDYPWNSPYAFSENRVIDGVELEGLEYLDSDESVVQFVSGALFVKPENLSTVGQSNYFATNPAHGLVYVNYETGIAESGPGYLGSVFSYQGPERSTANIARFSPKPTHVPAVPGRGSKGMGKGILLVNAFNFAASNYIGFSSASDAQKFNDQMLDTKRRAEWHPFESGYDYEDSPVTLVLNDIEMAIGKGIIPEDIGSDVNVLTNIANYLLFGHQIENESHEKVAQKIWNDISSQRELNDRGKQERHEDR